MQSIFTTVQFSCEEYAIDACRITKPKTKFSMWYDSAQITNNKPFPRMVKNKYSHMQLTIFELRLLSIVIGTLLSITLLSLLSHYFPSIFSW